MNFIADLLPQRSGLGETQVMRTGGLTSAHKAGLRDARWKLEVPSKRGLSELMMACDYRSGQAPMPDTLVGIAGEGDLNAWFNASATKPAQKCIPLERRAHVKRKKREYTTLRQAKCDNPKVSRMIIVKEGFFKADLCNVIAKGTQAYQWSYGHKSDTANANHNKFFVSYLWNKTSQENFFYMLWRIIHKDISFVGDCHCWRIIANGQVKGQNGNWHTDHGDKTILYFPLEWKPEWGGSTYFKIGDAETQIQYKQNQILAFNSGILHYGSCPTVDNILRVSIAFNLRVNEPQSGDGDVVR